MLNLTTVTDQHSSQSTKPSRHTYQIKRTNQSELNDCADQFHPKKHTYQTKHTDRC